MNDFKTQMVCSNCKHFNKPPLQPSGECRCNPPQLMGLPLPNGQMQFAGVWPPVREDAHCGHWYAKPGFRFQEVV